MPDGSPSCPIESPATLTSRISTRPASVGAAAAIPAVRGIDLHGHHHTGSAPGTEAGGLRDRPCALSPSENTSNPGQAGPLVAAGSTLLEGCPLISHRPHAIASRPRSSRRPGSGAVVWATDPPSYPATRPAKSSPGWRTPSSPPPAWVTPQTTPAATNPRRPLNIGIQDHQAAPRMRAALPLRLPEPLIPAARGAKPGPPPVDPSRDMRATADVALKDVTGRTSHRQPVQTGT